MNKAIWLACVGALALAACSEETTSEIGSDDGFAMAEESVADAAASDSSGPGGSEFVAPGALPVGMPKLTYDYGLSFRLPSGDVGKLMRRHASLCEQQGPLSCRIVGMDLSGDAENENVHGTLQLAVAADHARAVSALIENEAIEAGAEQVSATIGSGEVSKQIVDTEARIRSRVELRDRLLEVLRTKKGKVSELVEAERHVAEVNEEIDQARSWLAEVRGRVAFSKLDIDYAPNSGVAGDFLSPIEGAFGSLGSIMGRMIAVLIVLGAIVGPFGLAALGLVRLRRRYTPGTAEA